MSPEQKRWLLGLAREGEAWITTMRAMGIPERQEAEFYRVYSAYTRALRLMEVGEWPPRAGWADDLLDEEFYPPSYTMESYRRDLGLRPKLVCVDGGRRDE